MVSSRKPSLHDDLSPGATPCRGLFLVGFGQRLTCAREPHSALVQEDRLIDGEEAGAITGVKSRSRRYALIAQGKFPQPVKIGNSTRFSERECRQFVADRIAERDWNG